MRPASARLLLVWLLAAPGVALLSGCPDPCVQLAERICACEPSDNEARACRTDRITNRQSQIVIDDADRDVCEAALDTCTCTALDENRLELCGFVPAEAP